MRIVRQLVALAAVFFWCPVALRAEPTVLKSPGGKVEISFSLSAQGAPLYSVTFAGKPVVADSPLGLTLRQTGSLASGLRVVDVKRASRDETYTLVAGKMKRGGRPLRGDDRRSRARRREALPARGGVPRLRRRRGSALRAAEAGRASTPSTCSPRTPASASSPTTRRGRSSSSRSRPATSASSCRCRCSRSSPSRSSARRSRSRRTTASWSRSPRRTCAAGRACTSAASRAATTRVIPTLVTKLAPLPSQPGVVVRGTLPMQSPWRVLMLGARPGDLIESTILTSLADPNEIGDTSWIKPGKVSWDWWNGPGVGPAIPNAAVQGRA